MLTAGCISIDNDSGGEWVRYRCSNGRTIEARYDNSDSVNPRAELVIAGRRIDFVSQRSGSGARYVTENGLRGNHGLIWWTKGRDATLYDYPLADRRDPERPLASCTAS